MSDVAVRLSGTQLSLDEYFAEFDEKFRNTDNRDCWKIERRQHFIEQGSASYEAFRRGEWKQALKLLADRRPNIQEYYRNAAARGIQIYRVRVVEKPISSYLIWQLNSLRQRNELGENTRVVDPRDIADHENDGELPEIVGLGTDVAYQVIYDSDGAAERAIRSADRSETARWRRIFTTLYESGDDMGRFYDRCVASLQP